VAAVREAARPLGGAAQDYDTLLDLIGDSRMVLLGEASHGTHEFYQARAQITKRLIEEKGVCAVAVEADWPDAYRVNRYVQGRGAGLTSVDALEDFKCFPTWMWRNADVLDFVGWLRDYNEGRPAGQRAGFYGLDLYSLYSSSDAVIRYLDEVDPEAAGRARYRYGCFEHFGEDPQAYGYAASFDIAEDCEAEVITQLVELRRSAEQYMHRDGCVAEDEFFFAEQNARVVKNAEEYYRSMFQGRVSSWNLRDRHMAETLDALLVHLERQGRPARVVVWEHNSHLGDARATEMGEHGELNVGQLVRERYGSAAVLVGFTTYSGSVTAASDWGGPAERKTVRPALPNSYELLFHEVALPAFFLPLRGAPQTTGRLPARRLERAIGVIYRPETELASHYFQASLPEQFDEYIWFDETTAVRPFRTEDLSGLPDTYPFGL
jgi:erythromycin esterase-like protein